MLGKKLSTWDSCETPDNMRDAKNWERIFARLLNMNNLPVSTNLGDFFTKEYES